MSRARTLFPLLENPEYRPYAPIVDACAQELLESHALEPSSDALVLEQPGPPEIVFDLKPEIVSVLHEIADNWGKESGTALRDVAATLLAAERHEPGFHVVVVTRHGAAMLWFPSATCAEARVQTVAMAIATLRGFAPPRPRPFKIAGHGYAVRSPECSACSVWSAALREARIPLVGRVAPEPSPCDGGLCEACRAEVTAIEESAARLFGLDPERLAKVCEPRAVLEAVWGDEDFELARKQRG